MEYIKKSLTGLSFDKASDIQDWYNEEIGKGAEIHTHASISVGGLNVVGTKLQIVKMMEYVNSNYPGVRISDKSASKQVEENIEEALK